MRCYKQSTVRDIVWELLRPDIRGLEMNYREMGKYSGPYLIPTLKPLMTLPAINWVTL